ncbi:MAG: restriction endonuclease subunit S [Polyangiaceae bacterium]|nr:restriction endonuclease subunit S [Polyangiaceae bacterium]
MGEWREVQLGEVADLLTGFPFKSQYYSDDPADPRLIGGDNIVQGSLRWDNVRRWPHSMTSDLERYWLAPGDVVLAMDRPWIEAGLKRAAIVREDLPALLVQRTARLRGSSTLDNTFLRYVIGSHEFVQYILGVQTGTAVPHISPAQIRAFRFLLPPLSRQRAIAHILGALDDKIELNRRMNETLEAMARALFKSWFVDFDPVRAKAAGRAPSGMDAETAKLFPSEFVQSDMGEIPRGWRVGTVGEFVELQRGAIRQASSAKGSDPVQSF